MMQGVLNIYKDKVYLTNHAGQFSLTSGQSLYLIIQNCRIPVVVIHSSKTGRWRFRYLENIDVAGQRVVVDNESENMEQS